MTFMQLIDHGRILQIRQSVLAALAQKEQQTGLDIRFNALQRNAVDAQIGGTTAALETIDENRALTGAIGYHHKCSSDTA